MSNRLYSRKTKCHKCGSKKVILHVKQYECLICGHKDIEETKTRDNTTFRRGGFSEPHDYYENFKGKNKAFHGGYNKQKPKYKLNKRFRNEE